MSEAANEAFLERFSSDPELRSRVAAVDDPVVQLALIRAAGFPDVDEGVWERTGRLDDEALERATGGTDQVACDVHLLTGAGDGVIDGPSGTAV